jgi:hypothetical protein
VLKEESEAAHARVLHGSNRGMAGAFRSGDLGGSFRSGKMSLGGRMSGGESALFFWFGPAHRAADRQDVPQSKFFDFHITIIQHAEGEKWSIVLSYRVNATRD